MNGPKLNEISGSAVREVRADRDTAHQQVDRMAEKIGDRAERALEQAGPKIGHAVKRGSAMAHKAVDKVAGGAERGVSWVRESGERVRDTASVARDRTAGYVREDPIKSVLMAAAAGALLYAITRAFRGRDDR